MFTELLLCFIEKPLHLKENDSFVAFPLLNGQGDFELSLEIKPEQKNLLVLYMNGKSNRDHLAIAIMHGKLELRYFVIYVCIYIIACCLIESLHQILCSIVRDCSFVVQELGGGGHILLKSLKGLWKIHSDEREGFEKF